ncbi:FkbM family methyltransferase [Candidatus Bathyarchaeota archaeon]|nr:FkbM family methyltransferase [Candidatus Bathyarchaeota archaeon]
MDAANMVTESLIEKYVSKFKRAINTIQSQGFSYFVQNYSHAVPYKFFRAKKSKIHFTEPIWRNINFKALNLEASAKLLLNPLDDGFSKEFYLYGFREPLNTFAIYNTVAKTRPVVLDVGGNLGYFPLVELAAGAKKVIAVEPVPSTFALLSKTLTDFDRAELLNIAISDRNQALRLYVGAKRNVTSTSKSLLTSTGHIVAEEINIDALTLASMAKKYPITMVRMDVEGHEYRILANDLPNQIRTLCVELHIIPPYDKPQAVGLLQSIAEQKFDISIAINEMNYGYYPIIQHCGLKSTYKLATSLNSRLQDCPKIQTGLSFDELVNQLKEGTVIHLLLQR